MIKFDIRDCFYARGIEILYIAKDLLFGCSHHFFAIT